MKRKYSIALALIVLIALTAYKLIQNKESIDLANQPPKATEVRIPVKVATVSEQQLESGIVKTGNLAPFKEAQVLTTTAGIVEKVYFKLGDQVRQGQVLAVMDTRAAQLDLQNAEANEAKLRNDLQTYQELLAGKAATQEKVNEIKLSYQDAVNGSKQIRRQIAEASIKAPTGGVISTKEVEQGSFASAGTTLGTIVNLSQAKVQVNLTEAEVYQVKQGQPVNITTEIYPAKVFAGKVTFISPQADAAHNYLTEILVDNSSSTPLRSGTFVYADFSKKTSETVLVIPREAITESVKDASVFVVGQNGKVKRQPVQIGREVGGMVEVISGLQNGEQVVTSGQINLQEGTVVTVSK